MERSGDKAESKDIAEDKMESEDEKKKDLSSLPNKLAELLGESF